MKTLQEMSFGHIAIESIMLFVVIIAALYLMYATAMSYIWLFKDTAAKNQQTKDLVNKIKNDKLQS